MCHKGCLEFARIALKEEDVRGKSVIEVGSLDVNGTLRSIIAPLGPARYVGVDLDAGPGVDVVCDATQLLHTFDFDSFDLLISTEMLEHVKDWRRVVSHFKHLVRPNGVLLITTRSRGCGFHAFPEDHWRYELSDMKEIFSDFTIEELWKDPYVEGVFLKARKPAAFIEFDTAGTRLFSIIKNRRALHNRGLGVALFKLKLLLRILRKKPQYVTQLFTKPIYEVATRLNHPG